MYACCFPPVENLHLDAGVGVQMVHIKQFYGNHDCCHWAPFGKSLRHMARLQVGTDVSDEDKSAGKKRAWYTWYLLDVWKSISFTVERLCRFFCSGIYLLMQSPPDQPGRHSAQNLPLMKKSSLGPHVPLLQRLQFSNILQPERRRDRKKNQTRRPTHTHIIYIKSFKSCEQMSPLHHSCFTHKAHLSV